MTCEQPTQTIQGRPRRREAAGSIGVGQTASLIEFAERIVIEALERDGSNIRAVRSVTAHVWSTALSARMRGDAACVAQGQIATWRTIITDSKGAALAEVIHQIELGDGVERPPMVALNRSMSSDERRASIAQAATEVIAEKGYAAASIREIAAAAGVHVPSVYQYFHSKEEILELVYAHAIDRTILGMEPALAQKGRPSDQLSVIVERLIVVNRELRRETGVLNRETRSLSQPARARVLGMYGGMITRIAEVIARGSSEGQFRKVDPHLAALFIDALADVYALRPFAVGQYREDTYDRELISFVHGALTARGEDTGG